MTRDFPQRRFRIEFRHDDYARADLQCGKNRDEGPVVIERPRHQENIIACDLPELRHERAGNTRLSRHDQLGPSRRASGGRRFPGRRNAIGQVAVVRRCCEQFVDRNNGTSGIRMRLADHDGRIRKFDDRLQFAGGKPKRNRLRHRAELPGGVTGLNETDAVRQGNGEEIALSHPFRRQAARDAIGTAVKLSPATRLPFTFNRNRVALDGRFSGQRSADGNEFFLLLDIGHECKRPFRDGFRNLVGSHRGVQAGIHRFDQRAIAGILPAGTHIVGDVAEGHLGIGIAEARASLRRRNGRRRADWDPAAVPFA